MTQGPSTQQGPSGADLGDTAGRPGGSRPGPVLSLKPEGSRSCLEVTAGGGHGSPSRPVFLPGEPHGQRSLVCHSPGGHREADVTT